MSGDGDLDAAVAALQGGGVVAIPTDTVYGLAVDPSVPGATEALFALKARPPTVALPVLVASPAALDDLGAPGDWLDAATRLADAFWPGALTVVVPRRVGLDWDLGGTGDTVGLRCPDDDVARLLCRRVGPLATTSANPHGLPPCHEAGAVRALFGDRLALVLDDGPRDRPPSTVVALGPGGPRCLRTGALAWERVLAVLAGPGPG
ncbi:MAG TPA: L-threonylcarbamoyladenylate synthase [Acidimicrobiales bacterium]|nr:L-threonylcarbamoyladenylate synthase [Acidimicrobiales bacterium]